MKIEKIHLNSHPLFGTMDIDFKDSLGHPLDTVVIAGANGTGKTTLLYTIVEMIANPTNIYKDSFLDINLTGFYGKKTVVSHFNAALHPSPVDTLFSKKHAKTGNDQSPKEKELPVVVYMPTEINFDGLKTKTLAFSRNYQWVNTVGRDLLQDIPSYLATLINNRVYSHPDLPAKNAIAEVCNEINGLFAILEMDTRMVGLNPEGEKLPIFQDGAGKIFDINGLSSGEKQLFVRAMTIRMLAAHHSIILVDEPEISMHPAWQQKIIKIYQTLGKNNQVIVATHSPHVISAVEKESVKLLRRESGRIKLVDYTEIDGAYGLPVDIVLQELMGLATVRDPGIDGELQRLWGMLHKKDYKSPAFTAGYLRLENLLGKEDQDLLLMRIEIAKLEAQKGVGYAGSQKD